MSHNALVLHGSLRALQALRSQRPDPEYLKGVLRQVLPKYAAPYLAPGKIRVTDHALREFRQKFPRYAGRLGDGDLLEDLQLFIAASCLSPSRDGKDVLICHVPIWDKMRIIVRREGDELVIVTVSRQAKDLEIGGNQRAAYGVVLAQQLLPMTWTEMCAKLSRFEHSNGRVGWGMVLARKGTDRPLGAHLTVHELLDFFAYRNYLKPTLLGRRLAHIVKRMELPECDGDTMPLQTLRAGTGSHGLWADPANPSLLTLEMLTALIQRLEREEI